MENKIYSIDEITMDRGKQLVSYQGQVFSLVKHNYGFQLYNITNAGLPGKECLQMSVSMIRDADNQMDWWNDNLMKKERRELIFSTLQESKLSWRSFEDIYKVLREIVCPDKFYIFYQKDKAVRFFPFHDLKRIKPLKKYPKKWTLPVAIRAIVNGQFEKLRTTGKNQMRLGN